MSTNHSMVKKSQKKYAPPHRKPNNGTLNIDLPSLPSEYKGNLAKHLYDQNKLRCQTTFATRKPTSDEWIYNKLMEEILLQFYLICVDYRKMAEITLNEVNDLITKEIKKYLTKYQIPFKIEKDKYKTDEKVYYLYLFKNRGDMSPINNNRGISVAEQLGEFYTCKSSFDEWKKYDWRIIIAYNSNIEIFAQKCVKEKILENMATTIKVYNEIFDHFCILDEQKFKNTIPNPLQIHIYKSKPKPFL